MNVEQLKNYCKTLPGVSVHLSGAPANLLSYKLLDKKSAYFKTSEPEQWRFSIRVTPDRFVELTDQPGIKPARYMHRFHWVSLVNGLAIDEVYLKMLIDWSYHKALASLSKKRQVELLG